MQEAFIVLARAKREAEGRLRKAEEEGRASAHKLSPIKSAIRDLEEAYKWLTWCHEQKLILIRLWNLVEEGNREHVQVLGSKGGQPKRQTRGSRRRT